VPRELTQAEIHDLIERFGRSAGVAKKAGFTGVQIHGAHGYLVSQFLSPHHNQRTDHWGGSLQNRSRFVLEIYDAIRAQVGPGFPVSIKLNSADFQRGGFDNDDSIQVMKKLEERGIDLIEVSGGTYEAPAMTGARASTIAREGYFLDFIGKAREHLSVPLCVTGGFRTAHGMAGALRERADLVGLARSLAIEPDFVARVLAGEDPTSKVTSHSTGVRRIDRLAMFDVTWYENQLARMAAGKAPRIALSPWTSLAMTMTRTGLQSFRKRRS
jgi:2,4-dienoyl-CoA reductase-like NADH-dependent reductase (Old Yellow Enzyme family)